jgi:hypothetical protein
MKPSVEISTAVAPRYAACSTFPIRPMSWKIGSQLAITVERSVWKTELNMR